MIRPYDAITAQLAIRRPVGVHHELSKPGLKEIEVIINIIKYPIDKVQ